MTNQWDYIDIGDDDGEIDDDMEYDEKFHTPQVIMSGKPMGGFGYQHDDSMYMNGSTDYTPRNQLYWTVDATRDLIKLRGEREPEFEQGGARKSLLWVEICEKMQALGYNFSVEKVSKKWHNIMITYNKNVNKKYRSLTVNWEFFEDIDKIFRVKREQAEAEGALLNGDRIGMSDDVDDDDDDEDDSADQFKNNSGNNISVNKIPINPQRQQNPQQTLVQPTSQPTLLPKRPFNDHISLQRHIGNGNGMNSMIKPIKISAPLMSEPDFKKFKQSMESSIGDPNVSLNMSGDMNQSWWREYMAKRLEIDREKMKRAEQRHKEQMNFQKMALLLQEKIERNKIEAINNLISAINKLSEAKKEQTQGDSN